MAKFGYNGNTIRIQRNVYFISGNMQGKYKKLPLNCNELIPKRENFVFGNNILRPATLLKKRFSHRCFPMNFAKFLRTPFLHNTSRRLFLNKRNSWIEVSDKTIPKPKISELNDFQSILIVLPHPPFLNEEG